MAIHFETATPKRLLATYRKAIDDGHVQTWIYDSDGDFTHTADQWIKKAWLRPRILERSELTMYILCPRETELSSVLYAIYHGRFVETMLSHCDSLFTAIRVSSLPEEEDIVGSSL